jgi:hypothetical protein
MRSAVTKTAATSAARHPARGRAKRPPLQLPRERSVSHAAVRTPRS